MKEIFQFLLITLFLSLCVNHCFADGIVEHHIIQSKILKDARQESSRETSIYLPEEYENTNKTYPYKEIKCGVIPPMLLQYKVASYIN